ncbi:MAG: hypothetical protein WBM57_13350, partial [Woeseiaceae bacterium]
QRGKQRSLERVDPALMAVLEDMAKSRLDESMRNASVTIEELEDKPKEPAVEAEPATEEERQ